MFNKNRKVEVDIEESKKDIAQARMEIYRERQELEIDKQLQEKKEDINFEIESYREERFGEAKTLETDLLKKETDKKVELAKLDSEILFKRELIDEVKNFVAVRAERDSYKAKAEAAELICKSKDETISLLDGIVKVVVGKLSKVDVGSLAVHVAPTKSE